MRRIDQGHPKIESPRFRQPLLDQHHQDSVGEVWLDTWETFRETPCSRHQ